MGPIRTHLETEPRAILLGPSLLVAPVLRMGARNRTVWLPIPRS